MPSTGRAESYKTKFSEQVENLFGKAKVQELSNFELVHEQWTFNFDSDNFLFCQRLRNFVNSMLRTQEMDQFMRALKVFFATKAKMQYTVLLDSLLQLAS